MIGLAIAFAYGVFHAVGPGHGKAVLLSYFLSQDAKISRGVWMGAQIAFFHVVSAIVIVIIVHLILQQAFGGPVDEMDFLKIASYGAITLELGEKLYSTRHGLSGLDNAHADARPVLTGLTAPNANSVPCARLSTSPTPKARVSPAATTNSNRP